MRTFIVLLQKEFLQIRRDSFIPKMIIMYPIVIMLLLPIVMTMDVRNVNVAIADLDCSTTSRRIASHIEGSENLSLVLSSTNYNSAMNALEKGDADVIIKIPDNFEHDMALGTPKQIGIAANAVNATKGAIGMQYVVQAVAGTLAEMQGEKAPTATNELITVENRYNPTQNYQHYMIPALMIMLFVLLCGFLPALSIVSEKEKGSIEQINVTPVSRLTFTIAKLIPFWLIGLFVLVVAMIIAGLVYDLIPEGSVGVIFLSSALFIFVMSGFSVTIANFSHTMQQTMFVMFFFIMIFLLMSGMLTPVDSMPQWAQSITYALPPRYIIEILRSVYLKGATFMDLWTDIAALAGFAVIFNILATVTYKKQA